MIFANQTSGSYSIMETKSVLMWCTSYANHQIVIISHRLALIDDTSMLIQYMYFFEVWYNFRNIKKLLIIIVCNEIVMLGEKFGECFGDLSIQFCFKKTIYIEFQSRCCRSMWLLCSMCWIAWLFTWVEYFFFFCKCQC